MNVTANEMMIVRMVQAIHIMLVVGLLVGWLPAWKLKAKGAGNVLWKIYGICMIVVVLLAVSGNPKFSLGDRMRDRLITGDHSPYAMLNKAFGGRQRGMSYRAGCYIAQTDGIRITAIVYYFIVLYTWKSRCRKPSDGVILKDLGMNKS